jgi:tetratricopeptide (TPR) repeat protein
LKSNNLNTTQAAIRKVAANSGSSELLKLCGKAFELIPPDDYEGVYQFGVKLASMLLGSEGPVDPKKVEQAISVLRRVEKATAGRDQKKWAYTQRNLGLAYQMRDKGSGQRNLLRAKRYFEAALKVFSRGQNPTDWALSNAALGDVLSNLKSGSVVENTCEAIKCYRKALTVYTKERQPEEFKAYSEAVMALEDKQERS